MNLSDLKAQDTVTFELIDPRDGYKPLAKSDGTPMTITAYTSDSQQYRGITTEIRRTYKNRDPKEEIDPNALGTDLLVKILVKWDVPYADDKNATIEQMESMIRDPAYGWLRDQIDRAVHDRKRFFTKPQET